MKKNSSKTMTAKQAAAFAKLAEAYAEAALSQEPKFKTWAEEIAYLVG